MSVFDLQQQLSVVNFEEKFRMKHILLLRTVIVKFNALSAQCEQQKRQELIFQNGLSQYFYGRYFICCCARYLCKYVQKRFYDFLFLVLSF